MVNKEVPSRFRMSIGNCIRYLTNDHMIPRLEKADPHMDPDHAPR